MPEAKMTLSHFAAEAKKNGWTLAQLRCDVPPTEKLLAFMDRIGLDAYESLVTRYAQQR